MIALLVGVLVTVSSLMLAFFLAVSNVSYIVENDFISKANKNGVLHALARGQLAFRARTLTPSKKKITVDPGYLRYFHDNTYNNMTYNITLTNNNTSIDVSVTIK
ncbi:MAG: hypothetical protein MUC52_01440 [Candidatus Omnitrophica bacterium]|nr:hypothetical protein [Candidatus Omnitrophota bacterium]